jgi:hypothetical protein
VCVMDMMLKHIAHSALAAYENGTVSRPLVTVALNEMVSIEPIKVLVDENAFCHSTTARH